MICFITGPVGCGKSTRLLELYNTIGFGDGFYNARRFVNGKTIGQDLVQLSTQKSVPFTRTKGHFPNDWDEEFRILNYSFSKKGLQFAEELTTSLIKTHKIGFIDEIGPLELEKKGLYLCINKLLHANIDLFVVCRDTCVASAINMFGMVRYCVCRL